MNIPFALAGGLTAITVLAHLLGGTPEFMAPVYESNAPEFNKVGMNVIWDWVTIAMSVNAIALFIAARGSQHSVAISGIVISQFIGFGVIFLWHGLTAFGSAFIMPQWIAFFLISLFCYFGLRKQRQLEIAG